MDGFGDLTAKPFCIGVVLETSFSFPTGSAIVASFWMCVPVKSFFRREKFSFTDAAIVNDVREKVSSSRA